MVSNLKCGLNLERDNLRRTNREKKMNPPVQTPWHRTWSRRLCTAFAPPLHSPLCCTLHTCHERASYQTIWCSRRDLNPLKLTFAPPPLTWSWARDTVSCCSPSHPDAWRSTWEGSAAWGGPGCSPIWSGCQWRPPVVNKGKSKNTSRTCN